jgi:hypothetical protein
VSDLEQVQTPTTAPIPASSSINQAAEDHVRLVTILPSEKKYEDVTSISAELKEEEVDSDFMSAKVLSTAFTSFQKKILTSHLNYRMFEIQQH